MKRSAVVSVVTGWILLRVGVGLERMGREAAAARRRGVVAFGLGGFGSAGADANPLKRVGPEVVTRHGLLVKGATRGAPW